MTSITTTTEQQDDLPRNHHHSDPERSIRPPTFEPHSSVHAMAPSRPNTSESAYCNTMAALSKATTQNNDISPIIFEPPTLTLLSTPKWAQTGEKWTPPTNGTNESHPWADARARPPSTFTLPRAPPPRDGKKLSGGTGITVLKEAFTRTTQLATDPTGLGRWTSALVSGRGNMKTRIVAAYRPTKSDKNLWGAYQQQRRYFGNRDRTGCPRTIFLEDLESAITKWKEQGEEVIVGLDANEDVRQGDAASMFDTLSMREVILEHYGFQCPETCNSNNQNIPIDGIFATPGIEITSGGYSNYNDFVLSDHRTLFIDIPFTSILGHNPPNQARRLRFRVKPDDPRTRTKFNQKTIERYRHFNNFVPRQLQYVKDLSIHQAPPIVIREEINKLIIADTRAKLWADNKSRVIYEGPNPWSPRWVLVLQELRTWKLLMKRFDPGAWVRQDYLNRMMRLTGIDWEVFQWTKVQIWEAKEDCHRRYLQACKDAPGWRKEHLDTLAAARAKDKNTSEDSELKQLKITKAAQERGRRVRNALQKNSKGLATVLHRNNPGSASIEVCDEPHSLVEASIDEATTRFTRALDISPLCQEPFTTLIGDLANGPAVDDILNGEFTPPPGTDPHTCLFLQHMQMPEMVKLMGEIPLEIPLAEHQRAWKRQNHHTSADPRGLAFAHHKATAHDDTLSEVDRTIREIPLQHGIVPDEWTHMADCAIPKKVSNLLAEAMRFIVLMISAFNMNNKMMGKRVMARMESLGLMVQEQAGGRKNHQASHQALNKVLSSDILRQRHQAGFFCCNDAIQCYDRITHPVAILALRRLGVPATATDCMFGTLQQAKHHVLTGFGLSHRWYGGPARSERILQPLQGVMQGNGAGPMIWLAISTILVMCMRTLGYGALFVSSITGRTMEFAGFLFVDDADNIHTAKTVWTRATEIMHEFQNSVNSWEALLRTTGGGINPRRDKSFCCVIDFVWTGTTWRYMTKTEIPGELTIRKPTAGPHERVPLHRIEPNESQVTLGVSLQFDGRWEGEHAYLLDKAKTYGTRIAKSGLNKTDAWYSLHNVIMSTLRYPMPAISLHRAQWDDIMTAILDPGLRRSGVSKKFPKDIRFCPLLYQGLDIMHPFDEMHLTHLEVLLDQCNRNTLTGQLLDTCYQGLQLDLGLPNDITSHDPTRLHLCATRGWMKDTWEYCWHHQIRIMAPHSSPPLLRENDQYLMQAFLSLDDLTAHQLHKLRTCLHFLRAFTLTDITSVDGSTILGSAFRGHYNHHQNTLEWPRPPDVVPADYWALWQQSLHRCFISPYSTNRELRTTLGNWLTHPSTFTRCMLHKPTKTLFFRATPADPWSSYSRLGGRLRIGTELSPTNAGPEAPPADSLPATSYLLDNGNRRLTSLCHSLPVTPLPQQNPPTTLRESLPTALHQIERWAIENLHCRDDGHGISIAIQQGTARGISDGSYKEGKGSSAFTLHGDTNHHRLTGVNRILGPTFCQGSYRSEAGGLFGGLCAISLVCKHHSITTGAVEWALDGESVISKLENEHPLSPSDPQYDLLSACRHKRQELLRDGITVTLRYVMGHADDKKDGPLDWWEHQNTLVDQKAKQHLFNTWNRQLPVQPVSPHLWYLIHKGIPLPYFDKTALYESIYEPTARKYWERKSSIPHSKFKSIHWRASKRALRGLPPGKRRWIAKHCTGHSAVGRMMKIRKDWTHSRCPRCAAEDEDRLHVLLCPSAGARATWEESLGKLNEWLTKVHTDPDLHQAIMEHLQAWGSNTTVQTCYPSDIRAAIVTQGSIGWYNFMMGRICTQFETIQSSHYLHLGSKQNGYRWTTLLARKLMDISWDMWQHRNAILHQSPHPAFDPEARDLTTASIREEWERGLGALLGPDKHLFRDHSLPNLLAMPLANQKAWLESVSAARATADSIQQQADANLDNERAFMANFLSQG